MGGSGDARDQEFSTTGNKANASSAQRSIPIVDTERPGKVTMSMRAAGVTVVTYLSRGEGEGTREGEREGLAQQDNIMQNTVVTLTETSARQIEACSEIDTVRGKVRKMRMMARSVIQLCRAIRWSD